MIDQALDDVRNLHRAMKDGHGSIATGRLPFMEIVHKDHDARLPFRYLPRCIDANSMTGLFVRGGVLTACG